MAETGRPSLMTPETLAKLDEAFALGCTDSEACLMADISPATLYSWQNTYPEFLERKNALKETPFLMARKTIIGSLDNPQYAFEFMKRKKKDEFSDRSELTGKDGEALNVSILNYADTKIAPNKE